MAQTNVNIRLDDDVKQPQRVELRVKEVSPSFSRVPSIMCPRMLDVFYSTRFKKDYKQAKKQGLDTEKLLDVVDLLAAQKQLPPELKDHSLSGNYNGHRECHIQPDWLLIYKVDKNALILTLTRTGSHSELFGK